MPERMDGFHNLGDIVCINGESRSMQVSSKASQLFPAATFAREQGYREMWSLFCHTQYDATVTPERGINSNAEPKRRPVFAQVRWSVEQQDFYALAFPKPARDLAHNSIVGLSPRDRRTLPPQA